MLENRRKQKKRWLQNQNTSSLSKNSWGFSWTKIELSMICSKKKRTNLAKIHLRMTSRLCAQIISTENAQAFFWGKFCRDGRHHHLGHGCPLVGKGAAINIQAAPFKRVFPQKYVILAQGVFTSCTPFFFFSWDFFPKKEWTCSKPVENSRHLWFFQEIIQVLLCGLEHGWSSNEFDARWISQHQDPPTSKISPIRYSEEIPLLWQPLVWNSPNLCDALVAGLMPFGNLCFFPVFLILKNFCGSQNPDNEIQKGLQRNVIKLQGPSVQRLGHFAGITRDRDHAI